MHTNLILGRAQKSARRYRVRPVSLGGVRPGVDLDKALRLADALEDQEIARKLALRKSTPGPGGDSGPIRA